MLSGRLCGAYILTQPTHCHPLASGSATRSLWILTLFLSSSSKGDGVRSQLQPQFSTLLIDGIQI